MVVYICDSLNTTDLGGPCDDVSDGLSSCLGSTLIAAWAVGGQVIRLICILLLDMCIGFCISFQYCIWLGSIIGRSVTIKRAMLCSTRINFAINRNLGSNRSTTSEQGECKLSLPIVAISAYSEHSHFAQIR